MTTNTTQDGLLLEWYRTYIGEPEGKVDVYLGYTLFLGGVVLGIVALALFVYSGQFPEGDTFYTWRAATYILAMFGLPLGLLGVIVLLPVDRRGLYAGIVGGVICLVGIGMFVEFYPYQWEAATSDDYSVLTVATYSTGLVLVLAATGASLVAYHLERVKPHPADIEPEDDEEPGESYTDEEIQRDIEEALKDVEISWGGIRKTNTTPLEVSVSTDDIDASGMGVNVERVENDAVEDGVQGLKTLQGGQKKTARSTATVDDQTAQLKELRERKQNEESTRNRGSFLDRLRSPFDGLFGS